MRISRILAAGCAVIALASHAFAAQPKATTAGGEALDARLRRIDSYFSDPQSPAVYRMLAGMGDPVADFESPRYHWDSAENEARKSDLKILFPDSDEYHWRIEYRCRTDAPIEVLRQRRTALGAQHPYLQQWIAVERVALRSCATETPNHITELPPPLAVTDPALNLMQSQDRAYQWAALHFYNGEIDRALEEFGRVAADRASPHRPNAAYMMVAIQAGTSPDGYSDSIKPLVSRDQSLRDIRRILDDPSMSSVHAITAALIGWIGYYDRDEASRATQVNETLATLKTPYRLIRADRQARTRYFTAVEDIGFLHASFNDPAWWLGGTVPDEYPASRAMARAARHDPMAAWILFPANPYLHRPWALVEDAGPSHKLQAFLGRKLRGKRGADPANPWLHMTDRMELSVLSKMVDDEIKCVTACASDDRRLAALPLDYYQLIRRLVTDPRDQAARFDSALQRLRAYPFKATTLQGELTHNALQYLVTTGRLTEARRLRDGLSLDDPDRGSWRYERLLLVLAEDETHLARVLHAKYGYPSEYMNGLSISALWRLARREDLERGRRALYARTAWTRTYARGRTIDADNDALMRRLNPEITATWRSPAGRDVRPDDHRVLADVLASPGLNLVMESFARMPGNRSSGETGLTGIDWYNHSDNNWWCAWDEARHASAFDEFLSSTFGWAPYGGYESDLDRAGPRGASLLKRLQPALRASYVMRNTDRAELADLSRIDCAPKLLTERTIKWVKHPGLFESRDGQDEALANAVATTRWGCRRQGSHEAYSRAAYVILHAEFPQSAAAKRTKYWFANP